MSLKKLHQGQSKVTLHNPTLNSNFSTEKSDFSFFTQYQCFAIATNITSTIA